MYELLVNCIPPELILKKLMLELVRKLDDELKHKVADSAAFFEHRLQASCHFGKTYVIVHICTRAWHLRNIGSCAESCHWLLWHVHDASNGFGVSMTAAPRVYDHAKLYSHGVCTDGISSVKIPCVKLSKCMQEGQKAIFHLEAFVARFMSDYKTWTIQAFG